MGRRSSGCAPEVLAVAGVGDVVTLLTGLAG